MSDHRVVADLHCDLLAYLALDPARTPDDPAVRCALPQLREGGVGLQVLAMFALTEPGSTELGRREAASFRRLVDEHRDRVRAVRCADDVDLADGRTGVVAAIENASAFCDEQEPLDAGLARFERFVEQVGPLLYVSLTWNQENRFGGGNASDAGLADDGRTLLEWLADRGGTAVDLSHACPRMAHDVLDHLEKRGLDLPVCASHSCFAHFVDIPRNLPDAIARGIVARHGVIGLNLMRPFLGGDDLTEAVRRHVDHALALGAGAHYGFGADYFCVDDVPAHLRNNTAGGHFFPDGGNATVYPSLIEGLTAGGHDAEQIDALAFGNVARFVRTVLDRAPATVDA